MRISPTFTARTVLSNFGPWIVYGVISATGHQGWAYVGGLVGSLCHLASQWHTRHLKMMDGISFVFFLAGAISTFAFHSPQFLHDGPVLIWSMLAVAAWGSLLAGAPFTAEYAREAVPQSLWDTPGFRRVNAAITQVWGTVFVINAALAIVTSLNRVWSSGHVPVWIQAVPYLGTIFGIVFTNRFPQWAGRQGLKANQPGAD